MNEYFLVCLNIHQICSLSLNFFHEEDFLKFFAHCNARAYVLVYKYVCQKPLQIHMDR